MFSPNHTIHTSNRLQIARQQNHIQPTHNVRCVPLSLLDVARVLREPSHQSTSKLLQRNWINVFIRYFFPNRPFLVSSALIVIGLYICHFAFGDCGWIQPQKLTMKNSFATPSIDCVITYSLASMPMVSCPPPPLSLSNAGRSAWMTVAFNGGRPIVQHTPNGFCHSRQLHKTFRFKWRAYCTNTS